VFRRIPTSRRWFAGTLLGLAAAALLASCDLGDEVVSPPPPPVVAHILITSHADTVLAAVATQVQFTAVAHDAGGAPIPGATIQWSSSVVNVAAIDGTGRALALTAGFTSILARSGAVQSAPVVLRVHPAIASVVITGPANPEVEIARTLQLNGEARDASGAAIAGIPLDWTTSDPNIAVVDANGVVVGVAEGRTDVRAAHGTVQSAAVELRVRPAQQVVASVVITGPAVPEVRAGESIQFSAEARDALGDPIPGAAFQWFSSNPEVAGIDVNGLATGLAAGTSDIRARAEAIDSAPVTLTVTPPAVVSVEIEGPSQVSVGNTVPFIAVARDAGGAIIPGAAFTWSSSNPNVATVDAAGTALGLAAGTTDIRATSESVTSPALTLTVFVPLSFATHIQPLLHPTCTATNCHGGSFPQEGLNLSPPGAYGELVNQLSTQNGALFLVEPGDPDNSYMYRKLLPCAFPNCLGSRMPRDRPPLPMAQLSLIRTWIATGANP